MQATFVVEGKKTSPSEMITDHIIPLAIEGLDSFGAPGSSFRFAETMAKKRVSPADWIAGIFPPKADPWRVSGELTRVIPDSENIFYDWLKKCKPKKARMYRGPKEEILKAVALGTPLGNIYMALPLPNAYIEKLIDMQIKAGKIKRRFGDKNEQLFDRVDLL